MSPREHRPLNHQDELRVGHAVDPEDPVVPDETRLLRGVDRLLSDEVPDRRESEFGDESFLCDDVAFVELADLDLELAFAEGLANQVRICGGDEGLFPLVIYLHPDGHRSNLGYNRSTSLYLFFAGLKISPSWAQRFNHASTFAGGMPRSCAIRTMSS